MICVNRPSSPPAGPGSDSVLLIACPDRGARSSAARRDSPIYGAPAKLNPGAHEVACFVADAASHVTIGSVCQNADASPTPARHLDHRAPTDGLPTRSYPWSGHSGSRQDLSSAPASASPSDDRSGVRRADDTPHRACTSNNSHMPGISEPQKAPRATGFRITRRVTRPDDHLCRGTVERGAPSTSPTASRRRPTAARRRAVLRPDRWRLHRHGHRVVATTARSRGPAGATSGLRAANCGCPSRPCPAGCSSWCAIRGNTQRR